MNQQIAECHVSVAEVGLKKRFTEEIVKSAACRMTLKEGASLMPRTVKLNIALGDILLKAAEKWRQQVIFVMLSSLINHFPDFNCIGTIRVNNGN